MGLLAPLSRVRLPLFGDSLREKNELMEVGEPAKSRSYAGDWTYYDVIVVRKSSN